MSNNNVSEKEFNQSLKFLLDEKKGRIEILFY